MHISLVNPDPAAKITIRTTLEGITWKTIEGQILTSKNFTDINTFEDPSKVKPAKFTGARKEGNELVAELPPHSVVALELK